MRKTDSLSGENVIQTFSEGKIVNNFDADRVQIVMEDKPSESVRADLKTRGFRWSPTNKAWQRKNTNAGIAAAEAIIKKHYTTPISKPAQEKPLKDLGPAPELRGSIGAARPGGQDKALKRAQELAKKKGEDFFVVQNVKGRFAIKGVRPKKGAFTVVRPDGSADFIKQASVTKEDAFDFGEQINRSEAETAVKKIKEKLTQKAKDAASLRDEIRGLTKAAPLTNSQKDVIITKLAKVGPERNQKTNIRDLQAAIVDVGRFLKQNDQKAAIASLKKFNKEIFKKFALGRDKLGKLRDVTRKRIFDTLEGIDLVKLSEGKKVELNKVQGDLQKLGFDLANGIDALSEAEVDALRTIDPRAEQLRRLAKKPVSEMTADDIRDIEDSLRYFVTQNELQNKLLFEGQAKEIGEIKQRSIDEISPVKKKVDVDDLTKKQAPGIGKSLNTLVIKDSMHINKLISMSTNPKSKTMMKILDTDRHAGKVKALDKQFEIYDAWKKGLDEIGWTDEDFNAFDEVHEIKIGGKTKKVNSDIILSFGMNLRSPRNLTQLRKTIGLEISGKNTEPITISELVDAVDLLSDKQKQLIDLVNKIDEEIVQSAVNETSLQLLGYELARTPFYWGLRRVGQPRVQGEVVKGKAVEDLGPFQPFIGGTGRLRIVPFREQLFWSWQTAANFHGMAIPLKNARSLLNDLDFQQAMKKAGRDVELRNLMTLYSRIQGARSDKQAIELLFQRQLNLAAKSILGFRVSTILAQTGSLPMAYTEIPTKYSVSISGYKAQSGKAQKDRMDKFSSFLRMRGEGGKTNIETGNVGAQSGANMLLFGKTPALDKPLEGMRKADRLVMLEIDRATQRWVFDTTDLKPGSDEFWKEVARREEDAVRFTQPMWDIDERSVLSTSPNILLRSLLTFRSAREAMLNQVAGAADQFVKGGSPKELANSITATVVSTAMVRGMKYALNAALLTLATSLLGFLGIKRAKKRAISQQATEKFAKDVLLDLVGHLPFGQQLGRLVEKGVTGDKWKDADFEGVIFGTAEVFSEGWADISNGVEAFMKGDNKRGAENITRGLTELADAAARVKGLPLGGIAALTTVPVLKALNQPTEEELENKAVYLTRINLTPEETKNALQFLRDFGITTDEEIDNLLTKAWARPREETQVSPLESDLVIGRARKRERAKERMSK